MHQLSSFQYIGVFCVAEGIKNIPDEERETVLATLEKQKGYITCSRCKRKGHNSRNKYCVKNNGGIGHLSAFNINNDTKPRHDIFIDDNAMFKEAYGTKITILELNQFSHSIRQNLFPKYKQIYLNQNDFSNTLHVMFRTEGCNEVDPMTAYLIETGDKCTLPLTSLPIDRSVILPSRKYGLIAIGGFRKNSVTTTDAVHVLKWNENDDNFVWDTNIIPIMNDTRGNHSAFLMEDTNKIFVCGGYGSNQVELFSFKNDTWTMLKAMHTNHECGNICYDYVRTNNMYIIGGGWSDSQRCERYDFHKNEWISLPNTKYHHTIFPDIKINDNGLLICTGNHYNNGQWGFSEFLDLRDSKYTWKPMNVQSLCSILSRDDVEFFSDKTMRRICSL